MIKALAITGPTASGKTALSLSVSQRLNGEIICADSMQIYRGMDVGTAKATAEELSRVPHHLLDIVEPSDSFSCECYRERAMAAAAQISAKGRLPIFVGGTGLYIDTLARSASDEVPPSDPSYAARLTVGLEETQMPEVLWQRLAEVDRESANKIHKNNLRRVIRALEIYDATGKPKSYFDALSQKRASDIGIGIITLDFHNRESLYRRIDMRVDMMMDQGLLREVRELYGHGLLGEDTTASQAIGYKEIVSYLKGECTLEMAVEQIKLSSRRYAKRQLTWFRRYNDAYRLYIDREDGAIRSEDELVFECERACRELLSELDGTNESKI